MKTIYILLWSYWAGFVLFLMSFFLSYASNTLFVALLRSFIVWVVSFIILGVTLKVLNQTFWQPSNQPQGRQTITAQHQGDGKAKKDTSKSLQSEETNAPKRGEHIDLQTPEEEDFQPLQPDLAQNRKE
ncbi:hypothetical protein [Caldalkalibacillus salinus]|uniref:hypothetical protein n=1 Tax=Caldalkalibacillus salinus TaxID=2803787 RepID=UPI0019230934|nr:hypothetical protein [Caldalkalibacillus salinus]